MPKKIEEIILDELGIKLRTETEDSSNDDIIAVLKKYDRWFRSIAQRIIQQDQQIKHLKHALKSHGISSTELETVVVPADEAPAKPNKKKALKCAGCGSILQYATKNKCPICGSKEVSRVED